MDVLILTFNTLSTYGVLVNPLLNKVLNSVIEVVMKTKQTFSLRQLNGGTCNKSKEINEMYSYGLLEYNFFYIFIFYGMSFYFDNKHRDSVAYWCKIGLHFQAFQGSSEVNDYEMQFSKIRQGGSTQIQKMFEKLHTTHLKLFLAPFISSGNNVRTVWVIFVGLSFFCSMYNTSGLLQELCKTHPMHTI